MNAAFFAIILTIIQTKKGKAAKWKSNDKTG